MEILNLVSYNGDIDLIRQRIASAGADELNAVSKKKGNTPLHLAAIKGWAEIIALLLHAGADPNKLNREGRSALTLSLMAVRRGDANLVQLLLDHGADVNALDKNHESPLLVATREAAWGSNTGLVQLLLDHGADVNALDKNHESPLLVAAQGTAQGVAWGGNTGLVQLLLDHGADANANNGQGKTPLSIAAGRGDDETVKLLLNAGADPNKPPSPETQTLENPLKAAISNYYVKTATTLLQNGALLNGPAYDALAGFYKDFGADTTDYDLRRLLPERRKMFKLMLQHVMDPSQAMPGLESKCGDTLLHVMCRHDAPIEDILELLEHDGSTINTKNADGDTPLASHIGGEKLRVGVVRTLLEYSADATVINDEGLSLLSLLGKRPVVDVTDSVSEMLIDNGADDPAQSQPPQAEQAPTPPNTRHGIA